MSNIIDHHVFEQLKRLLVETPVISLDDSDKYVIMSDLHVGNRTSRDDFLGNSLEFMYVLEHYYLKNGYKLILNGDIEELQKFRLSRIEERWPDLYALFERFKKETGLIKVIGNHDHSLRKHKLHGINSTLLDALKFQYEDNIIMVYHGHQAGYSRAKHNLAEIALKYIARPFGIKNITRDHDNKRRLKMEQRVYNFSAAEQIVSIISHTHRPLFESLSEIDYAKFEIESLLHAYIDGSVQDKEAVKEKISVLKQDLERLYEEETKYSFRGSLYNEKLPVPAIFNSGCVMGKRGITGIELQNGKIRLVHWYDRNKKRKYFRYSEYKAEKLLDSPYARMVLKDDSLHYVFSRIHLLA